MDQFPALTMGKQETEIEKNRFLCNKCGHTSFYQSEMKEHTMRKHNRDPKENQTSAVTVTMLLILNKIW